MSICLKVSPLPFPIASSAATRRRPRELQPFLQKAASTTLTLPPSFARSVDTSSGGAMANVLLAAYPEVFAAGAIVAELPYGVASSVPEALERMRGVGLQAGKVLSSKVRKASKSAGPWLAVSIWHGSADHTVTKAIAHALAEQGLGVHGLAFSQLIAEGRRATHNRLVRR